MKDIKMNLELSNITHKYAYIAHIQRDKYIKI